jgi:hypothetical protein
MLPGRWRGGVRWRPWNALLLGGVALLELLGLQLVLLLHRRLRVFLVCGLGNAGVIPLLLLRQGFALLGLPPL